MEMVQSILQLSNLDINVQDVEHQWTPLHRTMYHGHIRIALLLLSKKEIDPIIVDKYGLTPFQLFSTVHSNFKLPTGIAPNDLLTWGTSIYGTLGYHCKNETPPELHRIIFRPVDQSSFSFPPELSESEIWDFAISKMHAVLVTSMGTYVWGRGSLGRLGFNNQDSLHSPTLLHHFKVGTSKNNKPCKVAVAQDHTLLLTSQHHVFGFGSNAHRQLGLPQHREVVMTPFLLSQLDFLKKEPFTGVSTSNHHTALYHSTKLIMFGYNVGQFGIEDKELTWIEPRIISCVTAPQTFVQVVCTNYATAVLTNQGEVTLFTRYRTKRLHFPAHTPILGPNLSDQDNGNEGWKTLKITTSQKVQHVSLASDPETLVGTAISSDGGYLYFFKKSERPASSFPTTVIWSPVLIIHFAPVSSVVCGVDAQVVLVTVQGYVYVNTAPHLKSPWRSLLVSRVTRVFTNELGTFALLKHRANPKLPSSTFSSLQFNNPKPSEKKKVKKEKETKIDAHLIKCMQGPQDFEIRGTNLIYTCPRSLLRSYFWFQTMSVWHPSSPIDLSLFHDETIGEWLALIQGNQPIFTLEQAVSLLQLSDYLLMEDVKQYLAYRFCLMLSLRPSLLTDLLYIAYQFQLPSLLGYCEKCILEDPEAMFPYLMNVHTTSPFPLLFQRHLFASILQKNPTLPKLLPVMHLPSACFDSIKSLTQVPPIIDAVSTSMNPTIFPSPNFSPSDTPSSLSVPTKGKGKSTPFLRSTPYLTPPSNAESSRTKKFTSISIPDSMVVTPSTSITTSSTTTTTPSSSSSSSSSSSYSTTYSTSSKFEPPPSPPPMPSYVNWAERKQLDSVQKGQFKDFNRIEIESKFELALLREHKQTRDFGSGEWITFVKLKENHD
ncbi:hypothetical protein HMI54_002384 [Coelomomyces lativittatus]|nr:hypothetical protein HMI54_002384 [Coelomomyces lativittatus]